jgi:ATP-dependent DNA helicase RecQ
MRYDDARSLALLRLGTGHPEARFREGQEDAIRHVVEGRGRLLVVQKTGWGKSFVYFIATRLLRDAGLGPTLLVSPLLALMRNQIAAATRMGLRAVTINSDNSDTWDAAEQDLAADAVDVLLVAPERFANDRFKRRVLDQIAHRVGLFVVDEAHCISDWGHDFRPHYRRIAQLLLGLPQNLRLLATTATANNRVMDDLNVTLGPHLYVQRGDLARPSLDLQTIPLPSQAERLAWLADHLPTLPGHGIVYTLTVRDAERVAAWLRHRGLRVEAYTGDSGDAREGLEQALLENRVKALIATTALGMGFDKPDLGFVVHYQRPGSVVACYQQVGRAGRALKEAWGVMLSGEEDGDVLDWFRETAFPTRAEAGAVLSALKAAPDGLTLDQLLVRLNISRGRVQKTLDLLSLEVPAPIAKQDTRWQLTSSPLLESFWQRAERLGALRREEQRQMETYAALPYGAHMAFLIRALDGDPAGLAPPSRPPLPSSVDAATVRDAVAFLRRTSLPIEPRKRWPSGGLPEFRRTGSIPAEEQAEPGRALCIWGDAGWGGLVRQGKYEDGRFADALVAACVELVASWRPTPSPTWVTCVPSLRRPRLVPDLAARIAAALRVPFVEALCRTDDRPEQKTMANSAQQGRNLDGALGLVAHARLPPGPVLLVDDVVDSRWTMTVSAWLLRQAGAGRVWPLALSTMGPDA